MLNDKKLEDVRKRINNSTLLTDREKADWLNLLELMNDKQLGELEEILASEKPAQSKPVTVPPVATPALAAVLRPKIAKPNPPTPQATPPAPVSPPHTPAPITQQIPPLGHIANVPTDLNISHSVPQPLPSASAPVVPPKAPPAPPRPTPPEPPQDSTPRLHFQLSHVEDLQSLTLETLRKYAYESIISAIRSSLAEHGYFPILQLIEASPLYETYIRSGQNRLSIQATSDNSIPGNNANNLTQAELEFMTDLLSNMRFNRL